MPPPDDPPPMLEYRSAPAGLPPTVEASDVQYGFLWTFCVVVMTAGAVRGWVAVGVAVTAVGAVGVGRGLWLGRWGFLLGAGLFATFVGAFGVFVVWVAFR